MTDLKPYVVMFKSTATSADIEAQIQAVKSQGGQIKQVYDNEILKGFAATIPISHAEALGAKSVQGGELIDYVEPDGEMTTQPIQTNEG